MKHSIKINQNLAHFGCLKIDSKHYQDRLVQFKSVTALTNGDLWEDSTALAGHCLNRKSFFNQDPQWQKTQNFAQKLRNGEVFGATQKSIENLVHLGIGGSILGPQLLAEAYADHADSTLNCYFISNLSGQSLMATLSQLDPQRTLFLIVSKSFTTLEVMQLVKLAKLWLSDSLGEMTNDQLMRHFVGISSQEEAMDSFGIVKQQQFIIPKKQGGRFSVWSAVSLPIMASMPRVFEDFMSGGLEFDRFLHQESESIEQNVAYRVAVFLYIQNTQNCHSLLVIPYASRWEKLSTFLAQLIMESLGKYKADSAISPIVWGDCGTETQHSFFQMLHQDDHKFNINFILPKNYTLPPEHPPLSPAINQTLAENQNWMHVNALAQIVALSNYQGEQAAKGQQSVFNWVCPDDSSRQLGMIIAFYEYVVYYYAKIQQINPFDQPGVEFGKQVSRKMKQGDWSWQDELIDIKNYLVAP